MFLPGNVIIKLGKPIYQATFYKIVPHVWNRRIKMSTLESTISMLEVLPEADLVKIQDFIKKLFRQRGASCPFQPKSQEEIYRDLEISRQQVVEGKCQEMGQALAEISEKYGL